MKLIPLSWAWLSWNRFYLKRFVQIRALKVKYTTRVVLWLQDCIWNRVGHKHIIFYNNNIVFASKSKHEVTFYLLKCLNFLMKMPLEYISKLGNPLHDSHANLTRTWPAAYHAFLPGSAYGLGLPPPHHRHVLVFDLQLYSALLTLFHIRISYVKKIGPTTIQTIEH